MSNVYSKSRIVFWLCLGVLSIVFLLGYSDTFLLSFLGLANGSEITLSLIYALILIFGYDLMRQGRKRMCGHEYRKVYVYKKWVRWTFLACATLIVLFFIISIVNRNLQPRQLMLAVLFIHYSCFHVAFIGDKIAVVSNQVIDLQLVLSYETEDSLFYRNLKVETETGFKVIHCVTKEIREELIGAIEELRPSIN